ncbi:MAG: hypothetical protein MOGMAGMI_02047 [Candidatus Omnitrophica bacterium]|nr:hypothetical protein [Candidatus Omnitrophota bacterium]
MVAGDREDRERLGTADTVTLDQRDQTGGAEHRRQSVAVRRFADRREADSFGAGERIVIGVRRSEVLGFGAFFERAASQREERVIGRQFPDGGPASRGQSVEDVLRQAVRVDARQVRRVKIAGDQMDAQMVRREVTLLTEEPIEIDVEERGDARGSGILSRGARVDEQGCPLDAVAGVETERQTIAIVPDERLERSERRIESALHVPEPAQDDLTSRSVEVIHVTDTQRAREVLGPLISEYDDSGLTSGAVLRGHVVPERLIGRCHGVGVGGLAGFVPAGLERICSDGLADAGLIGGSVGRIAQERGHIDGSRSSQERSPYGLHLKTQAAEHIHRHVGRCDSHGSGQSLGIDPRKPRACGARQIRQTAVQPCGRQIVVTVESGLHGTARESDRVAR